MTVAISQLRYLPNLNYMQRIYLSDVFVLMSELPVHRRDYENRNDILFGSSIKKITIPICSEKSAPARNTRICDGFTFSSHYDALKNAYMSYPYFDEGILNEAFNGVDCCGYFPSVMTMLQNAAKILEIDANFQYEPVGFKLKGDERLYELCEMYGADIYISGVFGAKYIKNERIPTIYHVSFAGTDYARFTYLHHIFDSGLDRVRNMVKSRIDLRTRSEIEKGFDSCRTS